jgi:hypothetical protein
MLTRLRLPAIRDRLVGAAFSEGVALLEEAATREMNLPGAWAWRAFPRCARWMRWISRPSRRTIQPRSESCLPAAGAERG